MGDQGTPIPRPQRHKAMKFMEMVGPPGLEPGDIGYSTHARVAESSRPMILRLGPAGARRDGPKENNLTDT